MLDTPELPPPTPSLAVLGALFAALEDEMPGITERARIKAEDAFTRSQVPRIRGPNMEAEARAAIAEGSVWLDRVATLADARVGWKRREKRKRRAG